MFTKWPLLFLGFLLISGQAGAAPNRVITLAPNLAEWTAEILGKEEVEKRLVGVSEYSDYPAYIKQRTTIGPYPHINIEKILKLKPDLVIALEQSNDEEQLKKLERLKFKILRMPQEKFNEMPQWILKLGTGLGEINKANAAVQKWKSGIQVINNKMARVRISERRVFIEVQDEPLITIGGPSFLSDAFKLIGYKNIFSNLTQSYPKISRESVLAANPGYIFILDLRGSEDEFKRARLKWLTFKGLKAVEQDEIRFLKGDDFARCTLRLLKALEKLI